ncbi:MAG: hypothetical protein AAGB34_06445, partial [Planctomycetota bacterium]
IVPRAIAMTSIVRSAFADLFLHGTGGAVYDRVAELWTQNWTGWPLAKLAPIGIATADVLLPIAKEFPLDSSVGSSEAWLAHHARHDPGTIGDKSALDIKERFLEQISDAPRGSREKRSLYKAMHAALEGYRTAHIEEIASLDEEARLSSTRRTSAELAHSRTWSFVHHPPESIDGLRMRIASMLNDREQSKNVVRS